MWRLNEVFRRKDHLEKQTAVFRESLFSTYFDGSVDVKPENRIWELVLEVSKESWGGIGATSWVLLTFIVQIGSKWAKKAI